MATLRQRGVRLGFWFALLLCRSPQFRRHSEALAEYLTHVVLEVSGNAETTRATADDALRHQNEYIRLMLKTASNIVDCLIERHWLLMCFDTGGLFLSDHLPQLLPGPPQPIFEGGGFCTVPEVILPLDRQMVV